MKSSHSYMWKFIKGSFGKRLWLWLFVIILGLIILLAPSPFSKAASQPDSAKEQTISNTVYLLQLDDEMISPITADYIHQGITNAEAANAQALLIKLDTPGGMLSATHTIVKDILNSPVPVIVYVAPPGARAGSAGVFITMSANIAAMAPYTRIGAAHPVDSNGQWPASSEGKGPPGDTNQVMSEKILNDTLASIRAIAQARGRNAEWAAKAVTQSESLTAEEALKKGVIDIVAPDVPSLLSEVNGRQVQVSDHTQTLHTTNPNIVHMEFTSRQKFLGILTHPFLAYILLMIGFYGLLFEVTHPGFGLPGVVGGICLLLALIGMQAMPVNMAGLGLIMLGLGLFIAEVFTPTFGVLFAGGLVCLVLGTLFLYQTGEPYMHQIIPYMVSISVVLGSLTGIVLWKVLKTYRTKAKGPYDKLIGEIGHVIVPITPIKPGKIRVVGEIWDAEADEPMDTGTEVQVVGIHPIQKSLLKVISRPWETT